MKTDNIEILNKVKNHLKKSDEENKISTTTKTSEKNIEKLIKEEIRNWLKLNANRISENLIEKEIKKLLKK